tara:strand:+ start:37602 stop:37943 length:342 start_codon:yes stop_codon:yes gene_type:complete
MFSKASFDDFGIVFEENLIYQFDRFGIKITLFPMRILLFDCDKSFEGIKEIAFGSLSIIKTKAKNKLSFSSPKSCFFILRCSAYKSIYCRYISFSSIKNLFLLPQFYFVKLQF